VITDWLLLIFRLLAPVVLYTFLGTMLYRVWKIGTPKNPSARLVAVDDTTRAWLLPMTTTIGRNAGNTIAIEDDFVSARHASLIFRDGAWWLKDAGSTNGTTLNGKELAAPTPILSGDVVGVGNHYFRLET